MGVVDVELHALEEVLDLGVGLGVAVEEVLAFPAADLGNE